MPKSYSLKQIAEFLGAKVQGDDTVKISGLGTLSTASSNDLAFVSNSKYIDQLAKTQAGAVILATELADKYQGNFFAGRRCLP
jgi:UDP-3-O-[3-hydroxymyristoyl] glucosamine N-acyltransferase